MNRFSQRAGRRRRGLALSFGLALLVPIGGIAGQATPSPRPAPVLVAADSVPEASADWLAPAAGPSERRKTTPDHTRPEGAIRALSGEAQRGVMMLLILHGGTDLRPFFFVR